LEIDRPIIVPARGSRLLTRFKNPHLPINFATSSYDASKVPAAGPIAAASIPQAEIQWNTMMTDRTRWIMGDLLTRQSSLGSLGTC
jgi:hypothetical protein